MTATLTTQLESVEAALLELEQQASESADVCTASRLAHEETLERQNIIFEGINAQVAILEETKARLLATTGETR